MRKKYKIKKRLYPCYLLSRFNLHIFYIFIVLYILNLTYGVIG